MPLPQVGQRFPSVTLETKGYKPLRIPEDFAGQTVVLSWFPYAFSPVCTEELTGFARIEREFQHLRATVVAASCDHWYSNEAYRASLGASYPFGSDWFRTEARKLGVFDEAKQRSVRSIHVIDGHGILRWQRVYETMVCPKPDEFLGELKKLAG
jgi:alkyl hydroperoxide reductase subunit AhpC